MSKNGNWFEHSYKNRIIFWKLKNMLLVVDFVKYTRIKNTIFNVFKYIGTYGYLEKLNIKIKKFHDV